MTDVPEDFAARLRVAVRVEDLSSGLDTEHVVAASRRKRRVYRGGGAAALVAGATGAALLLTPGTPPGLAAPPSSGGFAPQVSPAPEDLTADVDPEAGTIVFPLQRYSLSPAEEAEVGSAVALAMSQCAAERDVEVPWEPRDATPPPEPSNRLYGVWVLAEAEQHGYEHPNADLSGTAPGVEPFSDADLAVFEECNESAEVRALRSDLVRPSEAYLLDLRALNDGTATAGGAASPEAVQARTDWVDCLAEHGLLPSSDSPWFVAGLGADLGDEQSIRLAVIDVQCKTDVNLVQRLADADAAAEAPLIARHREDLEAMRAEYEAVLERARDYVETHAPGA